MKLPGAVSTARLPERARALINLLNIHYAVAGALLLLNLWLVIGLILAWRTTSDSGPDALAQQETNLRLAELQARPLEGLDTKLLTTSAEADAFYTRRLPTRYSQVLAELGTLTHREGVKLGHVQYAQSPVLDGTSAALTEVRIDAALTGDYRSLVLFVNALERDRMFFLIRGVTLTGQQSGTVGLRLRVDTWLRPGDELDVASLESPRGDTSAGVGGAPASADETPADQPVGSRLATAAPASRAGLPPRAAAQSSARIPVNAQGIPLNALQPPPSQTRQGGAFRPPAGGPPEIRSGNQPFQGAHQ